MFINYRDNLDNLDLSEQMEDISMNGLSAHKLTWNYSELYNLYKEYKKLS